MDRAKESTVAHPQVSDRTSVFGQVNLFLDIEYSPTGSSDPLCAVLAGLGSVDNGGIMTLHVTRDCAMQLLRGLSGNREIGVMIRPKGFTV